ncbi:hypothetical protein BO86DRAFT_416339 [Aspergillus japonicus CBS 114.51]|uniref:NmrA-like domain-containing protein n=1 Tax=Aspergillus japonicus CBS 114.51 TaxID=1448312 RepID=A0A8T8XCB9_ASPJA|nr:hypothetical protein BO86DRAFT_416339 [Aspergillus japonicus CBS 114.51]RAH85474.1 hypothetical protein BO86DRAFT_416339 [Aspergillus japonicus CBS 114.51]
MSFRSSHRNPNPPHAIKPRASHPTRVNRWPRNEPSRTPRPTQALNASTPASMEYPLHILGDADAQVDFTHIDDLATFLVATVQHPAISANRTLNFVSDRISYNEIAALLERFSGRTVEKTVWPLEVMHRVKGKSVFPDEFWILVRGMQGAGRFVRPPGEVHNALFPGVEVRTFERYSGEMFERERK